MLPFLITREEIEKLLAHIENLLAENVQASHVQGELILAIGTYR